MYRDWLSTQLNISGVCMLLHATSLALEVLATSEVQAQCPLLASSSFRWLPNTVSSLPMLPGISKPSDLCWSLHSTIISLSTFWKNLNFYESLLKRNWWKYKRSEFHNDSLPWLSADIAPRQYPIRKCWTSSHVLLLTCLCLHFWLVWHLSVAVSNSKFPSLHLLSR